MVGVEVQERRGDTLGRGLQDKENGSLGTVARNLDIRNWTEEWGVRKDQMTRLAESLDVIPSNKRLRPM